MVLVTTVYRDTTREEPSEISHSQVVRDLAVGCSLSILPHS